MTAGDHAMQRRRLDSLDFRRGRYILNGTRFDGIAYEVRDDRVTANYLITDGQIDGTAEAWDTGRPRLLYAALSFVDEDDTDDSFPQPGVYLNEAKCDGVAYAFDRETGVLLSEDDLRDCGPSRTWYPSGKAKSETYRAGTGGIIESEFWYENGQTSSIGSVEMGVGYTLDGRLRTLRLELDYPAGFLTRLSFHVDSVLDLAGPGVTDDVVGQLEEVSCVENLELSRTTISPRGLECFNACRNLKKFRARNCTGFTETDVRNLVTQAPACEWDGRVH